ncbi:hypothetical protein ABZP36_004714 [Zizania latifolia]
MDGQGASGRRRWMQRSCRTGGGGVVRRTVAAPAKEERAAGAAPRRTEGLLHGKMQQRVHGALSDFRSSTGSTTVNDYIPSDSREFKHKRTSGNSTRCFAREQIETGTGSCPLHPSVMAELLDFDVAMGMRRASQETSLPWARRSNIHSNRKLLYASSATSSYGSPCPPMFPLSKHSTNAKQPPPLKNSGRTSNFSYQLVRSAERSDSISMGSKRANYSLSEKMSQLRQPRFSSSHHNGNCIGALKRHHNIAHSGGATNMLGNYEVHKQPASSAGSHCQTLLDNALVRQNKLYCSEPNEELTEQSWRSTNEESEKAVCFSSSDSIDDLQASVSSDTSDKSSSLCIAVNDQWRITFKKVHCPLAARLDSVSVTNRKEIEQPSPVSVLEIPTEDCSAKIIKLDLRSGLQIDKCLSVDSAAEVDDTGISDDYVFSGVDVSPNDEVIQLVEDISEEFEDDEEREFSYLLDILIVSGIHCTAEDQLYKVCQSLDCPAGYDVFEKLEKKYMKFSQWSRSDRKLIFDMVNTILSEILAPCLDMHPWVKTARKTAPVWGSEGLLEKVSHMLVQRREELALSKTKPEKRAVDRKWPELADCIDKVGRDVENMIKDDLLEELLWELWSS